MGELWTCPNCGADITGSVKMTLLAYSTGNDKLKAIVKCPKCEEIVDLNKFPLLAAKFLILPEKTE